MHITQLFLVRSIFFIWGFATILNTPTAYYFKDRLFLNFNITTLVQAAYYSAYAIFAMPASRILGKFGYKSCIESGLVLSASGAFLFALLSTEHSFFWFLFALFIISVGTVFLQVALNPYVISASKKNQDTKNLNIAQAFNSIGTVFAPLVTSIFVFADHVKSRTEVIDNIYFILGLVLILQALFFSKVSMPHVPKPTQFRTFYSIKKFPHLMRGTLAIFFYVGAEVGVGFFLISVFRHYVHLDAQNATRLIILYWFLAMAGRFLSPFLLKLCKDKVLLAIHSSLAVLSIIAFFLFPLKPLILALPIIGFFNSIMFPTIFALSVRKLHTYTPLGAGVICFAIVGGAVLPKLQGYLADVIGLKYCFVVPLVSYLYILYFAVKGHTITVINRYT